LGFPLGAPDPVGLPDAPPTVSEAPVEPAPTLDPPPSAPPSNGEFMLIAEDEIAYSEDGAAWTPIPLALDPGGIAYGDGRVVVTTKDRRALVSTDRLSFEPHPLPAEVPRILYDGQDFVAFSQLGSPPSFYRSPDGISWTTMALPPNVVGVQGVQRSQVGELLAVLDVGPGDSAVPTLFRYAGGQWHEKVFPTVWQVLVAGTSLIGISMEPATCVRAPLANLAQTVPLDCLGTRLAYGDGKLFLFGFDKLSRSTDLGNTWEDVTFSEHSHNIIDVLYGNGVYVAIGWFNSTGVRRSTDGKTWNNVSSNLAATAYLAGAYLQ
jgi:hypothetical protein